MGIISFLIKDFKSDCLFIYRVIKFKSYRDQALSRVNMVGNYISNNLGYILKEYWLWYLIILLAFVSGFLIASAFYQERCNALLQDKLIEVLGEAGYAGRMLWQ